MSTVLDAPEVVVKNLIRDAWDPAATLDVTPSVHHGWLESEHADDADPGLFEVTVSNPDESPVNGGDTGYSGIDPTGAGPTQRIGGTVEVRTWAQRGRVGTNGNGANANPRQLAYLFKSHVEDIVHDHAQGTDAQGNPTDLSFLSPLGSVRRVDDDEEPVMYFYLVTVGYGYHRRP